MILYGDEFVIERLVEDNRDGFEVTGMFVCRPDERMLSLACNDEVAIVGFENGIGVLACDEPAPRLLHLIRNERSHQQIQTNENVVLSYSCPIGEDRPDRIDLYELTDRDELILRSTIEGNFERVALGDQKLVFGNEETGLLLYDIADIENPRRSAILYDYIPYFLTWSGDILASGDLIRNELGVRLINCNDPDDPIENAIIEENDHAYVLSSSPGLLAVSHLRWEEVVIYNIEDPDDPFEIRSFSIEEVGLNRRSGNSIRVFEEDIYAQSSDLPHAIFHFIPEGDDALTVVNRYYPPFGAEKIIEVNDNLVIRDRYRTASFTLDQNGLPRSPHPAWHANHGFQGYNVHSCSGSNWIAISQNWMGQWVTVFTIEEDGELTRQWEQNLGNPGESGIIEINDHLAIQSENVWQIMNIDNEGNVEHVGDTGQMLSVDGEYREGAFFCASEGTFRVFTVGEEVNQLNQISEINTAGEKVYLTGNAAYLPTPEGIEIIDISDNEAPELVQQFILDNNPRRIEFENNLAVVSLVNSIILLDISEPFEPEIIGWYNFDFVVDNEDENIGFDGIAVLNNMIYAGCRAGGPNGLFSFTIAENLAQQFITCEESWSIVSSYINPFEANVERIFAAANARNLLLLCKEANGDFYVPRFNHNGIGNWDVSQAYWVDMETDFNIEMLGAPVSPDQEIRLQAGWNGAAYYPRVEIDAEIAFEHIIDQMTMAKDHNGDFYLPHFGNNGFNNMQPLGPGLGYQVHVREAIGLTWNWDHEEGELASDQPKSIPEHFDFRSRTGENMSLLVDNQSGMTGEIGVYSDGLCVGAGVLESQRYCGIAIWGDDQFKVGVDGAVRGSKLELVWYDPAGQYTDLEVEVESGDLVYNPDAFLRVTPETSNCSPHTFTLLSAYPNPFNNSTKISFDLSQKTRLSMKVFDLAGREISTIMENTLSMGTHSYIWDAQETATGLYIIRLKSDSNEQFIKTALIK